MFSEILSGNSTKSQFARFVLVGGFTTLLNYAIFAGLFFLGINYVAASGTGYLLGLAVGFVLFKKYTFQSKGKWKDEALKQLVVYLFSLGLNLATLYSLVHFASIYPLFANIIAIGVSTITNFLGMRFFVFVSKSS